MDKQLRNTGTINTVFELYVKLKMKERTKEEEEIFNIIRSKHEEQFENSTVYFYKMNEKRAKVRFATFSSRCFNGWDKEKALTTKPKQKDKIIKRKNFEQIKKEKLELEQFEQDIIRFLENGLVLNRRQLKYIENNPAFAEKLKNRKVEC